MDEYLVLVKKNTNLVLTSWHDSLLIFTSPDSAQAYFNHKQNSSFELKSLTLTQLKQDYSGRLALVNCRRVYRPGKAPYLVFDRKIYLNDKK